MNSRVASVCHSTAATSGDASTVRLHALRTTYLLLALGLGATIVPILFSLVLLART